MKIKTINYKYGGFGLELEPETDVERMVLFQIFEHGEMDIGKGFFLKPERKDKSS